MERNEEYWYAVHVRARAEKVIEQRFRAKGLATFLPLATEVHRWSDRRKVVEVPLFACYVFVRLVMNQVNRVKVLNVDGVLSLVGECGRGTPVPDSEIETVRTLVSNGVASAPHPFLTVGDRVRIHGGALDGIEGILLSQDQGENLVISVRALERSLKVRIAGYQVEPLPHNPHSVRGLDPSSFPALSDEKCPTLQLGA
jgi:transcription antitermination factor NusG